MGKRLASIGLAAAIGVGGLAVAAVNPLTGAGAQQGGTPTTTAPAAGTAKAHRAGPLERALDQLVADGTLTQAQADKVMEATKAEAEAGKERRQDRRAAVAEAAAKAIGVSVQDLEAGVKGGTSIAEQAKAKGVERQVVDDAITKVMTERIDAAVADGTLTADQGAKAKEHLDKVVDRILDADGHRLGHRRGRGN